MDHVTELDQPTKPETFTFDDMRLQVGARLQIQIPFGANAPQHFTTLIGFVKDEYLIVRIPFENGLSIALPQEASVVVRVLSGVHVFAFTSIVRRVFLAPLFYAHLSFPEKIAGTVVRKAVRATINLPVSVKGGGGNAVEARFSNLSATGGYIESPSELGEREQSVRVSFTFRVQPGNREVKIDTAATIRNVRSPGTGGEQGYGYGVRFDDLPEEQMLMIQNLVYQALTENRAA
jgi:c-di-GMP-binding flagellar brake protein YcgR